MPDGDPFQRHEDAVMEKTQHFEHIHRDIGGSTYEWSVEQIKIYQ